MADLDPKSLTKLRVIDLKEHLSGRGLSTSGKKAELVKRLREALLNEDKNDEQTSSRDSGESSSESNNKNLSWNEDPCPMDVDEDSMDENTKQNEELVDLNIKEYETKDLEEVLNTEDDMQSNELEATEEQINIDVEKIAEKERLEREMEEERLRVEAEKKAEEEKLRIEAERKAEEKRLRIEAEMKAEEERLRIEAEKKAEEERLRIEAEKKAEEERLRIEAERKAEEKRLRIEAERKAEEERLRMEAERKAEEKRLRIEAEMKAEEERLRIEAEKKAEEKRLRIEAEMKAEEERLRIEAERKAEEKRLRIEAERKAEEKRLRIEAEMKAEEERLRIEAERKAEEKRLRIEAEMKAEEERKRIEAERKAEEKRLRIEAERKAEEERLRIEAERKAEEKRLRIEAEMKAEEERKRIEAERKAEEKRLRIEAEMKAEEERKRIEAERKAEEKRLRIEAEMKVEEERLRMEAKKKEERLRNEARKKVEEERLRLESERKAEEKRLKIEAEMKAEEERLQNEAANEEKRKFEVKRKVEEELRIEQERLANEQLQIELEKMKTRQYDEQKKYEEARKKERQILEQNKIAVEERQRQFEIQQKIKETQMMEEWDRRMAEEEEMRREQEKWLVEEHMLKVQEVHKKRADEQRHIIPSGEFEILSESEVQELDLNFDAEESMDTNDVTADIKLPQALEKVLALKTQRAQQLGVDPDSVVRPDQVSDEKVSSNSKSSIVSLVSVDEDEYVDDENIINKNKDSKNKRKKKKKKKKHNDKFLEKKDLYNKRSENISSKEKSVDIDVEYVQEVIDISDPMYSQFMKIFEKFKLTENEKEKDDLSTENNKDMNKEDMINPMALRKKPMDLDDDDDDDERDEDEKKEEEKPKLSKRKLKKLSRMTVAELKQKVNRPELVEMHDVTAKDPVLLLHLKASRNTVPVPRHWCFKRKYLQGKRGIEKPAFELPDFIKRTGIMEMRQALQEKEDQKTMKAKMRERVRPKLGKIDIDYQKLHDAFFKWQTKPRMTIHGDLYYEGKEFETRLKEKKPGDLSDDLRTALGMPTGPNANKCPPPWLIAMQRYGPPPSYPNLKIPGLNAPIPDSCSFGYHAGGWGKPPVDETGRPLYGDVFGTQVTDNQPHIQEEEIDHTLWGELESESSEEEEEDEDEEEEEEEDKAEDESGLVTPAEGLITPSGFSSIPAGMETPDMIELRKRKIEAELEGGETPALYTILPEKKTERVGAAMMGSTHIYDLAAAIPGSKLKMPGATSLPSQGIEVALDPSELEMDTAAMAARYEQTMREQQSQLEKEDLSDMVAEHAARQKNKRKKQQMDSAKPPKKYKEFKF